MEPDKYCRSCGTKYPWYEEECPDCRLPLSPLPEDQTPAPDARLVPVLQTTERGLLPVARVTLEQAGLDFTVEDRGLSEQLFGHRSTATVGETSQPFSILVRSEDAARARQLLEDLQKPATETGLPAAATATAGLGPVVPPVASTTTAGAAVDLHDAKTGAFIGSLTTAQFEDLSGHLERESSDDDDYYVDGATLDLLASASVDPAVVSTLRQALGTRAGMDVRWTRRAGSIS